MFTAHLLGQVHHENMFRREAECECFRCDSHAVWMSVVCVCVCAALPAGPGLPGGPANGCMKEGHAWNWNIRMCMHIVD